MHHESILKQIKKDDYIFFNVNATLDTNTHAPNQQNTLINHCPSTSSGTMMSYLKSVLGNIVSNTLLKSIIAYGEHSHF